MSGWEVVVQASRKWPRPALAVGAVLALLITAGIFFALLRGSPRAQGSDRKVTITLPPPVNDRIYASPLALGRPIVVIDAGHGGNDPGARGASGETREKDVTLSLAKELRDVLVGRGRVRVAMTREDDRNVALDDRSALARRLDAALFVSIHGDSAPNPLARGATVYSLSDVASDSEAALLAASQNRGMNALPEGDGSVRSMLADLAMRAQMSASADLALRMVDKARGRVELRPQPHRFAAFHVLRRADTPSVLFEAGYLSNAEDEALLRDPRHRSRIVLALAQAIETDVAARNR